MTALLLGAGASHHAGVPLSRDITRIMLDRVEKGGDRQIASALNFAVGALIGYDTQRGGRPTDLPDVERLFSAVDLLRGRESLEVSPFVERWLPAVDGLDRHDGLPIGFGRRLRRAIHNASDRSGTQLERALAPLIANTGLRANPKGDVYTRLLAEMLKLLPEVLRLKASVDYLAPIASLRPSQRIVTVATLNYDLSVETMMREHDADFDTGIETWATSGRWKWRKDAIRLLKLHGSLNWRLRQTIDGNEASRLEPLPTTTVVLDSEPARWDDSLGVIFGQRDKLRARGPFLGLLGEFERQLEPTTRLVAVGYSFRDPHINEVVSRWANGRPSRRLVVVDPHFPDQDALWALDHSDYRRSLFRAEVGHWQTLPNVEVVRESAEACLGRAIAA